MTEKVTNNIDAFSVNSDGTLSQPKVTPDPVRGLFDVVFSPNGVALIVQTGPAGSSNASSISSYIVEEGGTLSPVTGSVPTLGSFACWVALTPNGQFAYVSNILSSTITVLIGGALAHGPSIDENEFGGHHDCRLQSAIDRTLVGEDRVHAIGGLPVSLLGPKLQSHVNAADHE